MCELYLRAIIKKLKRRGEKKRESQKHSRTQPHAGSTDLIPGQGTRSHVPHLRSCTSQLEILHAATGGAHMQQLRPSAAK